MGVFWYYLLIIFLMDQISRFSTGGLSLKLTYVWVPHIFLILSNYIKFLYFYPQMARNHRPSHIGLSHNSKYPLGEDYTTTQPTSLEQHNMDFHMKSVIFRLFGRMSSTQNRWVLHYCRSQAKYFLVWCLCELFRWYANTIRHLITVGRRWKQTPSSIGLFVIKYLYFLLSVIIVNSYPFYAIYITK